MIFVDTNVFMYAVGREHPLRAEAQDFFESSVARGEQLATSAEVQQELMHAYLAVNRLATLDAALTLTRSMAELWSLEPADVAHARALVARHAELSARDVVHLACCQRRGVLQIRTFDRRLASAFG